MESKKLCKKCKELIHKDAKTCPKCFSKQGNPAVVIGIVVFLLLVLAIGSGNNNTSTNTNTSNSTTPVAQKEEVIEYIKVTKDQLEEELKENAAVAKDKYLNKYVELTGKLGTIDSDLSYISVMSINNKFDFLGVQSYLKNNEQKEIVKTLKKEQEIVVKGKIKNVGEVLGYSLDITEISAK